MRLSFRRRGSSCRRARHDDGKARPLSGRRIELDRMLEQRREPADDRQSQPHAATRVAGNRSNLVERLEYPFALGDGNARAGIAHFDGDTVAAPPRAENRAAARGMAHRVRNKVGEYALEQHRVAVYPYPAP